MPSIKLFGGPKHGQTVDVSSDVFARGEYVVALLPKSARPVVFVDDPSAAFQANLTVAVYRQWTACKERFYFVNPHAEREAEPLKKHLQSLEKVFPRDIVCKLACPEDEVLPSPDAIPPYDSPICLWDVYDGIATMVCHKCRAQNGCHECALGFIAEEKRGKPKDMYRRKVVIKYLNTMLAYLTGKNKLTKFLPDGEEMP
jgi:hypothetical protein